MGGAIEKVGKSEEREGEGERVGVSEYFLYIQGLSTFVLLKTQETINIYPQNGKFSAWNLFCWYFAFYFEEGQGYTSLPPVLKFEKKST